MRTISRAPVYPADVRSFCALAALCLVVAYSVVSGACDRGSGGTGQGPQRPLSDRARIVFDDSDGHDPGFVGLWENGAVRTLGSEALYTSVTISPDGRHVAAAAQVGADFSGNELHLNRIDDGTEVVIPLVDSGGPPAWAPDSSAVAITGADVVLVSATGDVLARTAARNRAGGGGPVVDVYAGWSPDGDEFAFVTEGQVVVLSARSGETRERALGALTDAEIDRDAYVVVWYWDSP